MSPVVQALLGASSFVVAVLAVWLALRLRIGSRRPTVRWRVDADKALRPDDPASPRDGGWTTFTVAGDLIGSYHSLVDDPSVVVLQLRNAGRRPILSDDWGDRPSFTFPGRVVVAVEVVETTMARAAAEHLLDSEADQAPPGSSRLVMRALPLGPKEAVRLAVLLSGRGDGIRVSGLLRDGRVVRERQGYFRRLLAIAISAAVLLCVAPGLRRPSALSGLQQRELALDRGTVLP